MKHTVIWFLAVTASSLFYACGKDLTDADDSAISASAALSVAKDCVRQRHDCGAMAMTEAEHKACSDQLRMCIQPLAGGRRPGDPIPDGGVVVPPPGTGMMPPDAGMLPPIGGLPGADAGMPGVPTTPPGADVVTGIKKCLSTLRDCLRASAGDPTACVTDVRDCIQTLLP
jgi:hypothetical protein